MIHFLLIIASFSRINAGDSADFQAILDTHLYAKNFNLKKASHTLIRLAMLHIFSFAKCVSVNPFLSLEEGRECFNERLKSGNIKTDFEEIVIDEWSSSKLTSKNTPDARTRIQRNVSALNSSRLLYLAC